MTKILNPLKHPIHSIILLLSIIFFSLLIVQTQAQSKVIYTGPRLNLSDYQLTQPKIKIKGINDNASGLTYNFDTQSIFLIVNNPEKIVEIDRDGTTIREILLQGFSDTEGIIYLGRQKYAITEERDRNIVFISINETTKIINKDNTLTLNASEYGEPNKGFEGLTYDFQKSRFYVVNEKKPRKIIAMKDPHFHFDYSTYSELWNMEKQDLNMDDLSGIHYEKNSGNLLLLSHESKQIVETTLDGLEVSSLKLVSKNSNSPYDIPQAEGITMDDKGRIYICSEPNFLYIFERIKAVNLQVVDTFPHHE